MLVQEHLFMPINRTWNSQLSTARIADSSPTAGLAGAEFAFGSQRQSSQKISGQLDERLARLIIESMGGKHKPDSPQDEEDPRLPSNGQKAPNSN